MKHLLWLCVFAALARGASAQNATSLFPLPELAAVSPGSYSVTETLQANPSDQTLDLVYLKGSVATFALNPFSHGPAWAGEVTLDAALDLGVLPGGNGAQDAILVLTAAGLERHVWSPSAQSAFAKDGGLASWAGATRMWITDDQQGALIFGLAGDGVTLLRARFVSGQLQADTSLSVPNGVVDIVSLDLDDDQIDEYALLTGSSFEVWEADGLVYYAWPTSGISEFLLELGNEQNPVLGLHTFNPMLGFCLMTVDTLGINGIVQAPLNGWSRGATGDDDGDGLLDAVLVERAAGSLTAGDRRAHWVHVLAGGALTPWTLEDTIEFTTDDPNGGSLEPQLVACGDADNDGDTDALFFATEEGLLHLSEGITANSVVQMVQIVKFEDEAVGSMTKVMPVFRWSENAVGLQGAEELLLELWVQPQGLGGFFDRQMVMSQVVSIPATASGGWYSFDSELLYDSSSYSFDHVIRIDLTGVSNDQRVGPTRPIFWSPDEGTNAGLPGFLTGLLGDPGDPTNTTRVTSGLGGGSIPPSGAPPSS